MNLKTIMALCAAVCSVSVSTQANLIGLYNTGVNGAGVSLPDGTIGDPHYSLTSVPSGSTTDIRVRASAGGYPVGLWLGDSVTSAWIGPNNDGAVDGPLGLYTYRTTFDLTGLNPATATISGQWATDDRGEIWLNGVDTLNANVIEFGSWTSFSLTGGFVAGINTLDFVIDNIGGGPTGVRVEMRGEATPVPEPTTVLAGALLLLPFGAGTLRGLRGKA